MFKPLKMVDEKQKLIRSTCKEVKFPLSKEYKDLIERSIKHLTYSQIEEYAKKVRFKARNGFGFSTNRN